MPFESETSIENAKIVVLPIPWEVTVSYGSGTRLGPSAIYVASDQLDFFSFDFSSNTPDLVYCAPVNLNWQKISEATKRLVAEGKNPETINAICDEFFSEVIAEIDRFKKMGKLVVVVGGDHSVAYTNIKSLADQGQKFSILHIDAHFDLREAYQGYESSHASVIRRVSLLPQVEKIISVGIRDFCQEEYDFVEKSEGKIRPFYNQHLQQQLFEGKTWQMLVEEIVANLSDQVYVTFDIDGLNPALCPHTGTPVPGGLEFDQAIHILREIVKSKRKIVGADLVEVAPSSDGNPWDANVGARVLYQICGFIAGSEKNS